MHNQMLAFLLSYSALLALLLGKIGGDLAVLSSESRRAPASPVKTVWDRKEHKT